jgi:hypothetical protein
MGENAVSAGLVITDEEMAMTKNRLEERLSVKALSVRNVEVRELFFAPTLSRSLIRFNKT